MIASESVCFPTIENPEMEGDTVQHSLLCNLIEGLLNKDPVNRTSIEGVVSNPFVAKRRRRRRRTAGAAENDIDAVEDTSAVGDEAAGLSNSAADVVVDQSSATATVGGKMSEQRTGFGGMRTADSGIHLSDTSAVLTVFAAKPSFGVGDRNIETIKTRQRTMSNDVRGSARRSRDVDDGLRVKHVDSRSNMIDTAGLVQKDGGGSDVEGYISKGEGLKVSAEGVENSNVQSDVKLPSSIGSTPMRTSDSLSKEKEEDALKNALGTKGHRDRSRTRDPTNRGDDKPPRTPLKQKEGSLNVDPKVRTKRLNGKLSLQQSQRAIPKRPKSAVSSTSRTSSESSVPSTAATAQTDPPIPPIGEYFPASTSAYPSISQKPSPHLPLLSTSSNITKVLSTISQSDKDSRSLLTDPTQVAALCESVLKSLTLHNAHILSRIIRRASRSDSPIDLKNSLMSREYIQVFVAEFLDRLGSGSEEGFGSMCDGSKGNLPSEACLMPVLGRIGVCLRGAELIPALREAVATKLLPLSLRVLEAVRSDRCASRTSTFPKPPSKAPCRCKERALKVAALALEILEVDNVPYLERLADAAANALTSTPEPSILLLDLCGSKGSGCMESIIDRLFKEHRMIETLLHATGSKSAHVRAASLNLLFHAALRRIPLDPYSGDIVSIFKGAFDRMVEEGLSDASTSEVTMCIQLVKHTISNKGTTDTESALHGIVSTQIDRLFSLLSPLQQTQSQLRCMSAAIELAANAIIRIQPAWWIAINKVIAIVAETLKDLSLSDFSTSELIALSSIASTISELILAAIATEDLPEPLATCLSTWLFPHYPNNFTSEFWTPTLCTSMLQLTALACQNAGVLAQLRRDPLISSTAAVPHWIATASLNLVTRLAATGKLETPASRAGISVAGRILVDGYAPTAPVRPTIDTLRIISSVLRSNLQSTELESISKLILGTAQPIAATAEDHDIVNAARSALHTACLTLDAVKSAGFDLSQRAEQLRREVGKLAGLKEDQKQAPLLQDTIAPTSGISGLTTHENDDVRRLAWEVLGMFALRISRPQVGEQLSAWRDVCALVGLVDDLHDDPYSIQLPMGLVRRALSGDDPNAACIVAASLFTHVEGQFWETVDGVQCTLESFGSGASGSPLPTVLRILVASLFAMYVPESACPTEEFHARLASTIPRAVRTVSKLCQQFSDDEDLAKRCTMFCESGKLFISKYMTQ
ncbi:hypothetical protein BJ742DRAFT_35491 [Cladochytrium replicatum]|nr:hypothetical protein BJ742DRAFT_35491 [Cladochytrium replicatum]